MGVFTCKGYKVDCGVRNRVVEANPDIAGVGVSFWIFFVDCWVGVWVVGEG